MLSVLALKSERERQRKTAAEAAQYLGVTEDMIRRYESGRSEITLTKAEQYAEFLGCLIGDVLPSSTIRSRELQTLLVAMEDFEADERAEIVDGFARQLAFIKRSANGRAARLSSSHPRQQNPANVPSPTVQTLISGRATNHAGEMENGSERKPHRK